MKLGLQIPMLTWAGGPTQLGAKLAQIARTADAVGYSSIWVMDHFFQIPPVGNAELDMLEAYTMLGFIAAHTQRARLGTLVTGVTYRNPGVLIKQVTTLDVLSGGRAYLGIGAAWFEREHKGMGVPFPPIKERFERLEDALKIAKQMWSANNGPYHGKHYQLAETLCQPQPLSQPHPPILIGGGGEKKTLKLAAKYANACNFFGDPTTAKHKLDVLRTHCEKVGRNYDEIEKTIYYRIDFKHNSAAQIVDQLGNYAEAGMQAAIGALVGVDDLQNIERVGRDIIPQAAKL